MRDHDILTHTLRNHNDLNTVNSNPVLKVVLLLNLRTPLCAQLQDDALILHFISVIKMKLLKESSAEEGADSRNRVFRE